MPINIFIQYLVYKSLILILIVTSFVYILNYYKKRRRVLNLANQFIPAPGALPLIGNGHMLLGSSEKLLKVIMQLCKLTEDKPISFWLGPHLVIGVSRPDHNEAILNNVLNKTYLYDFLGILVGHGIFSAPLYKWKKNRKLIVPTFNQKNLDSFVQVFQQKSEILTSILEKHVGDKNLDIMKHLEGATIAVISETAMGVKTEYSLENDKNFEFLDWVHKVMEYSFKRMATIYLHFDFIFNNTQAGKESCLLAKKVTNFVNSIIQKKKKERLNKVNSNAEAERNVESELEKKRMKPFLELLLEEAHFTDKEIQDEVITFMIAGSDTTAATTGFVLTMLGMHKDVQEKVYEEIIEIVGLTRPIEYSDIPRLKYTERAIKEAMRLFPIGPNIFRQVEEDFTLPTGEILPKGCTVCVCIINTHRSEKYYPDPLKYDPDRFLPEEVAKRSAFSYLPFSGGPRNCIGLKYGMMSMVVYIANILRKFHVHTLYKSVEEIRIQQNVVLFPIEGHKVYVTKRNNDK